ncbi:ankyrin repeat domain-containing protein 53 isoform X2 [Pseudophryne corroboree]|uniref:ankyrin repeat domain-containing protein 53 isoform X2 n=1 Tax=Pseudophryne corroboree TaxID=495146 RepID=UPI00308159D8
MRRNTGDPQASEAQRSNSGTANDQLIAASIGNVAWLQLSINTAESQLKTDKEGFTALHMAALHAQLQCLQLLIEGHKMDVNFPSRLGLRPLHLVLNRKNGVRTLACVRYLLQQGADVNAQCKNNVTALHKAATEGLEDCMAVLVEAGADVHAKDSEGKKPIDLCKVWCNRSCARYLSHIMWKRDKKDFALEIKKVEKLKRTIQEKEKERSFSVKKLQKPHTMRHASSSVNNIRLPEHRGGTNTASSYNGNIREEGTKPTTRRKEASHSIEREHSHTSQTCDWNPSTNPSMSPVTNIYRIHALRLGTHPEDVGKADFSSSVMLTKNNQEQPQIRTIAGEILSQPKLPYETIQRSLFPTRGPQDRVRMPQDFRARHVFDVQSRQQPPEVQRLDSEISFHLRQNLDPKTREWQSHCHPSAAHLQPTP